MDKADGTQFRGACETGFKWRATDCNQKLIGARYYADAFVDSVKTSERDPNEYISPRTETATAPTPPARPPETSVFPPASRDAASAR